MSTPRSTPITRVAALLAVLLLFVAACGSDGYDTGGADESGVERPDEIEDLTGMDVVEIEVGDNFYEPRNIEVDPGTELVFTNTGRNPHNVTPAIEGAFAPIDEDVLDEGPATLVIDAAGDYPYYCTIHGVATSGQTGYLVVSGS